MNKEATTMYAIAGSLSTGAIRPVEIKRVSVHDERYVYTDTAYLQQYIVGRDIFRTEAEAMTGADAARLKKIASLEKQIKKLRAMTFNVVGQP